MKCSFDFSFNHLISKPSLTGDHSKTGGSQIWPVCHSLPTPDLDGHFITRFDPKLQT